MFDIAKTSVSRVNELFRPPDGINYCNRLQYNGQVETRSLSMQHALGPAPPLTALAKLVLSCGL